MQVMSAPRLLRLATFCAVLVVAVMAIAGVGLRGDHASLPAATAQVTVPSTGGFSDVVARATPSVVQIRSARGLGSGIVYDDAGHVVTNAHVVAGSKHFKVTDVNGARHNATLTGVFPEGDLAVIDVAGAKLQPATFADSSQVHTGDYSLAIGNPLGLRSSVTMGIISATSRTVSEGSGVALPSVIQTSAPINPGNSGGALVDLTGAVVGIPTLAATDPQLGGGAAPGIGFAIPSNTVTAIAAQIVKSGKVSASGRAALDITVRTIADADGQPAGVAVVTVKPGGAAQKAGIKVGDVIDAIDHKPITSTADLAQALAQHKPGERVTVSLLRADGSTKDVTVTLDQLP
jgi:putative serine protease PepD